MIFRGVAIIFAAIFPALLLGGCASKFAAGLGVVESEVAGTIANIQRMNDVTANTYKLAPCAIDLGAYFRVLTPDEQRAADTLCGGSVWERPVTVEDLQRFLDTQ